MGTVEQLRTAPANDQDLTDILTACQSMLKHAKGQFDRDGNADASRLMIAPLNAVALALERRLVDLLADDWKPISTLTRIDDGIVLWERSGRVCSLNPEAGPLVLDYIRDGNVFTHWRRVDPPKGTA